MRHQLLRVAGCLKVVFLMSLGTTAGCSLLPWGSNDELESEEADTTATPSTSSAKKGNDKGKPIAGPVTPPEPTLAELSLKQAKLWARVDELENMLHEQRERSDLLEQGLMLGMVPEELKRRKKGRQAPRPHPEHPKVEGHPSPPPPPATILEHPTSATPPPNAESESTTVSPPIAGTPTPTGASTPSTQEDEAYTARLKAAQEHFDSQRYGRAIAEFSALAKDFPVRMQDGSHLYWIALSWGRLKEFETARTQFGEFIQGHPQSPWSARAKLELARIEIQSGLREKGLQRLQDVIRDHPGADAAEMAKMELKDMQKAL